MLITHQYLSNSAQHLLTLSLSNPEQQVHQLKDNIASLKSSAENSDVTEKPNYFIEHFKQYGNIEELTRPVLLELVDKIIVHENGELDIIFRFNDAFKDALGLIDEKSA